MFALCKPIQRQCGLGLRAPHHQAFLDKRYQNLWLEIHPENYFSGGQSLFLLEQIRKDYPLSFHSIGMSLGSYDLPCKKHLNQIKTLAQSFDPFLISDHLSWSRYEDRFFNDLFPLPYTKKALQCFCKNVDFVQSFFKKQILVENPSSYLSFPNPEISEWEFLKTLSKKTGCGLLLDVNNVFVSAHNHQFEAKVFIDALADCDVQEIHLAGHTENTFSNGRKILIDDHGSKVIDEVWDLFSHALKIFDNTWPLIEWDTSVPELSVLLEQKKRADHFINLSE